MNKYLIFGILIATIVLSGCVENESTPNTIIIPTETIIIPTETISKQTAIPVGYISINFSKKIQEYVGMKEHPSNNGMVYLIITYHIENHGYDSFNVNPYYWKCIVNNIQYEHDVATYYLNDHFSTQEILDNGKISGSIAFQIPKSSNYTYELRYDRPFEHYIIKWNH